MNNIGGAMVSVLAASMIDRLFDPRLGKTRDSTIGICYFSSKLTALMSKNTDWLAWNHNNVSELGDMSIHELLFQWTSTKKIQLSVFVQNKADLITISLKINLLSPWYSWKIAELALNNNHSLTLYFLTVLADVWKVDTESVV